MLEVIYGLWTTFYAFSPYNSAPITIFLLFYVAMEWLHNLT